MFTLWTLCTAVSIKKMFPYVVTLSHAKREAYSPSSCWHSPHFLSSCGFILHQPLTEAQSHSVIGTDLSMVTHRDTTGSGGIFKKHHAVQTHKMLSMSTQPPSLSRVSTLKMHQGWVTLKSKIQIRVSTLYCRSALSLLMWFTCSDGTGPVSGKLVTSFGSHFRQTTWGRLSARTFCCTEALLGRVDVAGLLQGLSLHAPDNKQHGCISSNWF